MVVPQLFEPSVLYQDLGFLAAAAPVPFIGSVRYLASAAPDTTLVFVGLSLASEALAFRRAAASYEARYLVELSLWREGKLEHRANTLERVRVATRQETRRADESIVFQQALRLAPGAYDLVVSVRDDETGAFSRAERAITVPAFASVGMTEPMAAYQADGRPGRDAVPAILLSPRATVSFGRDTLRFYVEVYGAEPGARVRIALEDSAGREVVSGDAAAAGSADLAWAMVGFGPDVLPVGCFSVTARLDGRSGARGSTALVTFSEQWAITNFDDVLSLLRWFAPAQELEAIRAAAPADRPALWRDFWAATDPNPTTSRNEALERYFQRVQEANGRFGEAGEPGWLTERGEVFVVLGEPDEAFDIATDFMDTRRTIRWTYLALQLTLDFVDDTGFGRYRLTPASRAEYERVRNRRQGHG
ncbi:MAG: GWxTD domain-containing protein [Synechococcaceae cyanobacterium]|nr:GWxTD domain-containing protein [Synechococcaceae cyanobacterium]